MAYASALFVAVAIIANMEWRTDEDLVTMATLIVVSVVLGWFRPRLFLLSGIALGFVIPALNLITLITGVRPGYETAAQASGHGLEYVISLLVLIGPASVGALIGKIGGTRSDAQPG